MNMREIIYNDNNLKENEMTDLVVKVKLMLINRENQILLAYAKNDYEFIGGTHEEGEDLIETINRELNEELGVEVEYNDLKPFAISKGYYKDWPAKGRNKRIEINYYVIPFDLKPNFDNMNLTENEKEENFTVKYVDLADIEEVINQNVKQFGDHRGIAKEMLNVIKVYREEFEK